MKTRRGALSNYLSAIALIIILLCFNKCKVYCPAFLEEYKTWFPYENNQELNFKSETTDSIILFVDGYYASEAHSFNSNCDCDCDNGMEFYLYNKIDSSCFAEGQVDGTQIDSSNIPGIYITLIIDHFSYIEGSNAEYSDSLYIKGMLYYDVLTIVNTQGNSGYNYSEIQVVKDYGIMSISDYEGNTWYLETEE